MDGTKWALQTNKGDKTEITQFLVLKGGNPIAAGTESALNCTSCTERDVNTAY